MLEEIARTRPVTQGQFLCNCTGWSGINSNFEITRKMQEVSCVKNILLHILAKLEEL